MQQSILDIKALEISKEGVLCEDKDEKQMMIPAKSIICALGQRSRKEITEQLLDSAPIVSVIGDASNVSTITNAVYQGYHAALDI